MTSAPAVPATAAALLEDFSLEMTGKDVPSSRKPAAPSRPAPGST